MSSSCNKGPRRHCFRVGKWLPEDAEVLRKWLANLIESVDRKKRDFDLVERSPVITEFQELIEGDSVLYMLFHLMFTQVPNKPPYNLDPTGNPQVRDYNHMLDLFDEIIKTAPKYQDDGLVGFPINAIIDWPMGTPAGFEAFHNDKVNEQIKRMLNEWAIYLGSPPSASVLGTDKDGWFGEEAMKEEQLQNFDVTFVCDPAKEYHGFTSWDNFFTRVFREGVRPVEQPQDNRFISNACESAPYAIKVDVKERDSFWIKSQPYSITDMLAKDTYAPQFVGGTVYQAFLSALSYHRWHSPVDGEVVKTCIIPGTYYSEVIQHWSPPHDEKDGPDPAAPNLSQGYLTEVATRALIFIKAENTDIGLMCFMAVGMAEVSTCQITVNVGDKLTKGQELGMFHFGGSTHCLMFRKGVKLIFNLPEGTTPGPDAESINVNSCIAFVEPSSGGQ